MAKLDEVKAAIAAERQQVLEAVGGLKSQIQALRDQIAAGTPATEQDLDDLVVAINEIFTPDAPETPPAPPEEPTP